MKLVDVNVWLATVWAGHQHHQVAKKWFDQEEDDLAFCRVTQMALLRMLTNKAITGLEALSRRGAWELFGNLVGAHSLSYRASRPGGVVGSSFKARRQKSSLVDRRLSGGVRADSQCRVRHIGSRLHQTLPFCADHLPLIAHGEDCYR